MKLEPAASAVPAAAQPSFFDCTQLDAPIGAGHSGGAGADGDDGFIEIPFYDASRAAGGGEVNEQEFADVIKFSASWIELELHANPETLALLYVDGESMEPTLRPGDMILIDTSDTTAARDGVYVLRMEGALLVKRLQRLPPNQIRVTSDNEKYQPFVIRVGESENIGVVGRVIWAGRRM